MKVTYYSKAGLLLGEPYFHRGTCCATAFNPYSIFLSLEETWRTFSVLPTRTYKASSKRVDISHTGSIFRRHHAKEGE